MSHSNASLKSALGQLVREPFYWLVLFMPVAAAAQAMHLGELLVFVLSCVAIVPLAGLMGRATENLAETMGAGLGGLLNATFGNAAELIIGIIALRQGPSQFDLVKASITGSIVSNILLVLGGSILAGGLRFRRQVFNQTAASMSATLAALACIGLLMPTFYYFILKAGSSLPATESQDKVNYLSEEIALILAIIYLLSLVFSLKTHQHLFAGEETEQPTTGERHRPEWSRRTALWILVMSTVGVAWMSELLVHSVEHAAAQLGLTKVFIGLIIVPLVGNAAEHSTAIMMAMKNKMDLSVNIAVGSSIQIALFVAPAMVFSSMCMGHSPPLDLHFTPLEIIAVTASVVVLALVAQDGESHWMEGVLLLGVYLILALAVFHLPDIRW